MKVIIPAVSRKKARHTAAALTFTGGVAHCITILAPYEAWIFAVAGVIAIYLETLDEPHIIHLVTEADNALD